MAWNVPDDWNCYYSTCKCGTKWHESEGGHDCPLDKEEPVRPWLEGSGYEWESHDRHWYKEVSCTLQIARKSYTHLVPPCLIQRGMLYRRTTYRNIDDETGKSWYDVSRTPVTYTCRRK